MIRRSFNWLALLVLLAGLAFSCVQKTQVSVPSQVPPKDPALVHGVLPNGFQYLLMSNTTPKDRVSMHLNVFAGSVHETEEERGLAHFLEHMLFNGSEHFKPGELITYFQSIGMDFGGDANARTSFFSTIYDLSLPKGNKKYLEDAFVVIKDYARGALLLESEINRERGVILAEKRDRDSVSYRTFKRELAFELPGSLLARRLPIGTETVINHTDRALMKAFYDRWYRPDNMALVVVGDMDLSMAEQMIKERFSSLAPEDSVYKGEKAPDIGWTPHRGTKVFFHGEPEAGTTQVTIERLTHKAFVPETLEMLKKRTTQYVGDLVFQNRLSRMVRNQSAGLSSASVYSGNYLKHLEIAAVRASCDPENWKTALGQLDYSLRQALAHGFLPVELDRVKADLLASLDAEAVKAPTRKSHAIARGLLSTLNRKGLFLSPVQERDLLSPHIKGLTLDEVNRAFKGGWPKDHRLVLVTGNLNLGATPEDAIRSVYQESQARIPKAYTLAATQAFPYLDLPDKPAKAVSVKENVKNLGIDQVTLGNGVRINLKPTDFKKGELSFKAVFGKGRSGMPEKLYGLSSLAEAAVAQSGFGAMNPDDLEAALAGKEVNIGFHINETHCSLEGNASPGEAELVFQLLYTYMNDPGFRSKGLALAKTRYRQGYDGLRRTPDGVMKIRGYQFLAGGDPRFGLGHPDRLEGISVADIESWLRPEFEQSPLEVSLVGDFDPERIRNLAVTYMGGLDARQHPAPQVASPETLNFPKGQTIIYRPKTRLDKAEVRVAFHTDDFWDIMQTRKLSLLSRVISERLRKTVRESLGAAYSPYVYNDPSLAFEGYGVMHGVVTLSPRDVDLVYGQMNFLIKDLVDKGVTQKELGLVKAPLLNHLAVLRQSNGYWLNSVMADSFRHPQRLDWALNLVSGYSGISAQDLTRLANTYLRDHALIKILPESSAD